MSPLHTDCILGTLATPTKPDARGARPMFSRTPLALLALLAAATRAAAAAGGVEQEEEEAAAATGCVEINQCVRCISAMTRPSWLCRAAKNRHRATPSSRRRVDGVEVDATIQHKRAVKF